MILFFSGVGNSRYVAYKIAKKTGDKILNITDLNNDNIKELSLKKDENLGIVSPVYFFGLPSIVKEYLSEVKINLKGNNFVYCVATYGSNPGAFEYMLHDILEKKDIKLDARYCVKMVDTWTPIFDVKNKNKNEKLLNKADKKIDNIIDRIILKEHKDLINGRILKKIGLSYHKNYNKYRNTSHLNVNESTCIGCEMCAKNCPVGAITIKDGHPVWNKDKCIMCLGCLHRCPKFAIQYDNKTLKHGQYTNPKMLYNSVKISNNNPCIEKIDLNCCNCGLCKTTCIEREQMPLEKEKYGCVGCGQCSIICPRNALISKNEVDKFLKAKKTGKICIAYTAPGVRVSIGDGFGYPKGKFLEKKLVGVLKEIGFDYVFDVTLGADMTIMEEASELIKRKKEGGVLPMMTSCCPSWVRYLETFYPELIPHLSTTKSPIAIEGTLVKEYFAKINKIDKDKIYTVAITPCTAKKDEILKPDANTDLVLTVRELISYLKKINIDIKNVKEKDFNKPLADGSGAGMIFGNTGGVMEASLRTAHYLITKKDLNKITFKNIQGYNGAREGHYKFKNIDLNVLVVDEMANAIPFLEEIKNGTSKYDFIEVMNCRGGCIGGGGQPIYKNGEEDEVKENRANSLKTKDKKLDCRYSYKNKNVKKIYDELLTEPLSKKSEELLHTKYEKKNVRN